MTTLTDIASLLVRSPGIKDEPKGSIKTEHPYIAGTRISIQQIAVLHNQGLSPSNIIHEYNFLTQAQVYAALAYYYANQAEIDMELLAEESEYDRLMAEQISQ